jgi:holliday junction DNA helicase RuvA
MFAYLKGNVLKIREKRIILDVHDVGYEVWVNSKTLNTKVGEIKKLWIYMHQTSDAVSLFGFEAGKDLDFFELLISVNGVGCKTALDILESPVEVLESIIFEGNASKLADTPGIGKKTAARIILELKPKITGGDIELPANMELNSDILNAVVGLGFSHKEAEKTLRQLPADIVKTEDAVRWFLKNA